MGIAGETEASEPMEVMIFPLHEILSGFARTARDITKEFSYKAGVAKGLLIYINMVGGRDRKYFEIGRYPQRSHLRQNVFEHVSVKRIVLGKTA
jgi:hypothetical protein